MNNNFKSQSVPLQQISSRINLYHQQCQQIKLTQRERQLLEWLSFGYSYQEMAVSIHISVGTIKNYFLKLREKFNAHNNSHLVSIIFLGGLFSANSFERKNSPIINHAITHR
ncbi:helix-turn-helix transcriptional regulator [Crocosphaera sp. Alani8]|uniref:helix-turn-helix transcriptional regulator n=1 Tax=Crocosphaera sp. Alani8 TaxID=3038952 RepID=UPI00313E260B